jgi:hypothetical protein
MRLSKDLIVAIFLIPFFIVGFLLGTKNGELKCKQGVVVEILTLQDSLYNLTVAYNESQYDIHRLEVHLDCYENAVSDLLIRYVPPPDTLWVATYTPFGMQKTPKVVRWPDPCIARKYFDVPTVEWLREGGK